MKLWQILLVSAVGAVLLASCGRKTVHGTPLSGPPKIGATYSLNDGEGGFRVAKVLVVEDGVVFVSLYGNRWPARPFRSQAHTTRNPAPLAFSLPTFAGLQPVHIEDGDVSAEESEAYETWKQSKQEPF